MNPERLFALPPRDPKTKLVNVVIDTPRGSRNKFKYDAALGVFKLGRILPEGHYFPYDFGSVPGTTAEDGDALDVMVMMDEPAFTGCLVQVRLIGVITGRQTEKGETITNDRLLAVPVTKSNKPALRSIGELGPAKLEHLQHFFVSYNQAMGRTFKPGRPQGPRAAEKKLERAIRKAKSA
ncbi:MAG: inorganic diphosphatase [Betaproteobacteria bacterium]|nr:inorganic diphosphatase [Betaproteobacteria bacterium]